MKKLIFIIVLASLIALLLNLPASFLKPLLPTDIYAQSLQGTLWKGQAQSVRYQGKLLGAVNWKILPACFSSLSLCAAIKQQGPSLQSEFILHGSRHWHFTDLTAEGDMKYFANHFKKYRITPRGRFTLDLNELQFAHGELMSARGRIEIKPMWLISVMRLSLGDIHAEIEPAINAEQGSLMQISNRQGHLDLEGQVQITPELSYESHFTLTPNDNSNRSVKRILRYLRGYQNNGEVQLSYQGQLALTAD